MKCMQFNPQKSPGATPFRAMIDPAKALGELGLAHLPMSDPNMNPVPSAAYAN